MKVEFLIYLLAFIFGLLIIRIKYRRRFYLNYYYTFFVFNFIFIVATSYFSFYKNYYDYDLKMYFLIVLLNEIIISLPLIFFKDKNVSMEPYSVKKINNIFPYYVLLVSVFYIIYGIKYSGLNMLPIVYSFIDDGSSLVAFRKVFWREGIAKLPMGSLIRFIAKYGMVLMTLLYYHINDKKRFYIFLTITIIATTLEGTKSGLIIIILPLVLAMYLRHGKVNKFMVVLILILSIGTTLFSLTETSGTVADAISDKVFARTFLVPNDVAIKHYLVTGSNYQFGNTVSIIANLKGGYSALLGSGVLDYDNYVYRQIFYEELGYLPTLGGSANGPYFIYGWDNFGLIGVILSSSIVIMALYMVKSIFCGRFGYLFYPIIIMFQYILITSQSLFSWFLGIDMVIGLVFMKLIIINPAIGIKKESISTYLLFLVGSVIYILGFLTLRIN